MTNQQMVVEFMRRHGLGGPVTDRVRLLRARLIAEEAAEAVAALQEGDLVGLADALADLLYVAYGTAVAFGFDLDACLAAVHKSNMTKDVLSAHSKGGKGPGFSPPDLTPLVEADSNCQGELFSK